MFHILPQTAVFCVKTIFDSKLKFLEVSASEVSEVSVDVKAKLVNRGSKANILQNRYSTGFPAVRTRKNGLLCEHLEFANPRPHKAWSQGHTSALESFCARSQASVSAQV